MKILVSRTDRIGDMILAIPTLRAIKHSYPDVELGFLVKKQTAELLQKNSFINTLHVLEDDYSNIANLFNDIKSERYTHVISLFAELKLSFLFKKIGIPNRIGPYSKLFSFFLYNKGVLQHRSRSLKNEAEYNLDLLKKIDINYHDIPTELIKPIIENTDEPSFPTPENFIVIHPGMGGSALNIAQEYYLDLYNKLAKKHNVFMTFGPQDNEYLDYFNAKIPNDSIKENLSLSELAKFYKKASLFIGPSTGPMHIAAACGTKVLAIFSPIRVQSANRWAPWGNDVKIMVPECICKQKHHCNERCPLYNCMALITPDKLFKAANKLVKQTKK